MNRYAQSDALVIRVINVKSGSDMAGQREPYKAGGQKSSGFSRKFHRDST